MIQRHSTHIKSYYPFYSLLSNRLGRCSSLFFFQLVYSQLNHCMRDSQITRSKISYSSIEPQPLPCTPACVHEFHALALTPHPTFTAPLVGSAFRIQSEVCGRAFLCIKAVGCLCKGGPLSLMLGNSVIGDGLHHYGHTRESLTPLAS